MARKKLELSEQTVAGMAYVGASNVDIAEFLGCSEATIRGRFCEITTKQRAARRIKLRQLQWRLAEKGNATMLIFLGKQELGQKDAFELGAKPDFTKWSTEDLLALKAGKLKLTSPGG